MPGGRAHHAPVQHVAAAAVGQRDQCALAAGVAKRSLKIHIADDGKGISPAQVLSPHSVGIAGMFDRARLFGGKLQIQGEPGKGTVLTLQIALPTIL